MADKKENNQAIEKSIEFISTIGALSAIINDIDDASKLDMFDMTIRMANDIVDPNVTFDAFEAVCTSFGAAASFAAQINSRKPVSKGGFGVPEAIKFASKFIEDKGIEIVDTIYDVIVFERDGQLVFAKAFICDEFPEGTDWNRADAEKTAFEWLSKSEYGSIGVTFDEIAVQIIAPDKCLLRHHSHVFKEDE